MTTDTTEKLELLRQAWARQAKTHTGSLERHKFGLSPALLTEGTKAMADVFGCYWLFDLITSAHASLPKLRRSLQVWYVSVDFPSTATAVWLSPPKKTAEQQRKWVRAGQDNKLPCIRRLTSSSFPLAVAEFNVECDEQGRPVIMMPMER